MTNYERARELGDAGTYLWRSCWECNPAHEHLKIVGGLFHCFECSRWFMNGGFFDDEAHCNAIYEEREPLKTETFTVKNLKR